MNGTQSNTWCCEMISPGAPCENPADVVVLYGNAPDDQTLMCEKHIKELWEPTWQTRELTDEERSQWAIRWSDWLIGPVPDGLSSSE